MSKWISVEDGSPDEHQLVDVFTDHEERLTDVEFYDNNFYGPEQQWFVDDCGYGCFANTWLIDGVTHWMPLPEPPEGK